MLLLHGFPESSWEWHGQMDALASAGYFAVAPEQRGYSPDARPEGIEEYSIDWLVGDVIGMADTLGTSTFHLVGHDWGAIVAWHVAAAHPQRLETLTIGSVPHPTAWAAAFADPSSDLPQRSAYLPEMKRLGSEDEMGVDFLRFAFNANGLEGFGTEPHIAVLGGPRGDARRTELVPGLRFHDDGASRHHGPDAVCVVARGRGHRTRRRRAHRSSRRRTLSFLGHRRDRPLDPRAGRRRVLRHAPRAPRRPHA